MAKIVLTPVNHTVLTHILEMSPVEVPKLTESSKMDRGRIEGTIANLLEMGLIEREIRTEVVYTLTKRGIEAISGLIERKLIDGLTRKSIHMKDLSEEMNIPKGEITAGIGILRKANLIKIDKGMVILDIDKAKTFSVDLQEGIERIRNGEKPEDEEVINQLKSRGLIEIEEKNVAVISTKLTKAKIKQIEIKEEVTKLTPAMLVSGEWKNVSFKPYSMETKPRILYAGRTHPYRQFLDHLRIKLAGLGFKEMKGPLVEQEFWNFDALYAPQDHPAREDTDILLIKNPTHGTLLKEKYVKNVAKTHETGWKSGSKGHGYKWDPRKAARLLMRPQGTAVSARTLAGLEPPAKYFSIARNFRPDQIDATHAVEFDQTEGIICDPDITFRDLLGILETFATEVAGASEVRFRPDYYPFTSPSVELSAKHPVLGYIEFGGAGIFRPEVTKPFGIDYPVLAWGIGVGRLFMTKYHISDIRELFSQNLEWLRNAEVASGIQPEE
ncbi:MAG: phenylalanine--tRNA ligase subunit alpha [Candidatus Heimdallarchaeota archaeon]|nr:phenylalanine--tRNA ligase subunit alpha [Candidatus Heimdallarchaeota archaeon]